MDDQQRQAYWRENLKIMAILLTIWALVSFVYVKLMDRLDAKYGVTEYEQEVHHS